MLTTPHVARHCEHVDQLFSQFQPLIFDNLTLCQFNLSFQRLKKGLYVVTLDMYINPQYTVCCFVYSWVRKQCCTLSFGPPKIILGPLWGLDPQIDKRYESRCWGIWLAAVCTRALFHWPNTTPHHSTHLWQVFPLQGPGVKVVLNVVLKSIQSRFVSYW